MKRFLPILLIVAACGGQQKTVERAREGLSIALTATTRAKESFVAWDQRHQAMIVDSAISIEDGQSRLSAYRAKRQKVIHAFTIAYSAIAAAANAVAIVDEKPDLVRILNLVNESLNAVLELRRAITELKEAP